MEALNLLTLLNHAEKRKTRMNANIAIKKIVVNVSKPHIQKEEANIGEAISMSNDFFHSNNGKKKATMYSSIWLLAKGIHLAAICSIFVCIDIWAAKCTKRKKERKIRLGGSLCPDHRLLVMAILYGIPRREKSQMKWSKLFNVYATQRIRTFNIIANKTFIAIKLWNYAIRYSLRQLVQRAHLAKWARAFKRRRMKVRCNGMEWNETPNAESKQKSNAWIESDRIEANHIEKSKLSTILICVAARCHGNRRMCNDDWIGNALQAVYTWFANSIEFATITNPNRRMKMRRPNWLKWIFKLNKILTKYGTWQNYIPNDLSYAREMLMMNTIRLSKQSKAV